MRYSVAINVQQIKRWLAAAVCLLLVLFSHISLSFADSNFIKKSLGNSTISPQNKTKINQNNSNFQDSSQNNLKKDSHYSATIPVQSQSSAEVLPALNKALKQVLVNVSHDSSILINPHIQHALANPSSVMQEFQYQSVPKNISASGLVLQVDFAPTLIDHLIHRAEKNNNQAPNTSNSILALVTINAQIPGQEIKNNLIGNHDQSLGEQFLIGSAQSHNIPLLLPLLDLQDLKILNVQDVLQNNIAKIAIFAKRYHTSQVLVANVSSYNPANWQSNWLLMTDSGIILKKWQAQGQNLADVIEQGLDQSGIENFSTKQNNNETKNIGNQNTSTLTANNQYQIVLSNITNFNAYTNALAYLRNLNNVTEVNVIRAQGDTLFLEITVNPSQNSFDNQIKNQTRFILIGHPTPTQYNLQWSS